MKKLFLLLMLCLPISLIAQAQSASAPSNDDSIVGDSVLVVVETMPEFPGGQQALFEFLNSNVKYPVESQKARQEGRVICQFVVDKDGSIVDVYVDKSSGYLLLDKEAVRVISSMPKWKPGMQRGKPVRVLYRVPVNFHFTQSTPRTSGFSELRYKIVSAAGYLDASGMPIEKIPHFADGTKALLTLYSDHLEYPDELQEAKIGGKGVVTFDVSAKGKVTNVHILKSCGDDRLDKSAVRAVKFVTRWSPAADKADAYNIICTVNFEFIVKKK